MIHAIRKIMEYSYLLIAFLIGLPLVVMDRLLVAPVVATVRSRVLVCMPTNNFFHATSQRFQVLDLTKGTGQLGNGLYLHKGFVTQWDCIALEIIPTEPLKTLHVVKPYAWQYILSTGHYLLSSGLPHNLWSHSLMLRYIWPQDRVVSPEFAYPRHYRQIRLTDSPRNRQWLETAKLQWIQQTPEGIKNLDVPPPRLVWQNGPL